MKKVSPALRLNLYRKMMEERNGKLVIHFHPGQLRAYNSAKRKVFIISGAQAGKTIFGPPWLYREILAKGDGDYLAVTSNFDLFRLKMLPVMREYFCDLLGIGKYWAGAGVIEIQDPKRGFLAKTQNDKMWARIILRSAVAQSGLESATAKACWIDECGQDQFRYEAWEAVQRRVALYQGRILGTTTPYNLGWLKTEVYDKFLLGDPDIDVVNFPSIENPEFPKSEYDKAETTKQKWQFEMFYKGLFSRPAGMIYEGFDSVSMTYEDREIHIPLMGELTTEERRLATVTGRVIVGLDFGGANTGVLHSWLNPGTNILHVFDESISGNKSTMEHAAALAMQDAQYPRKEYVGGSFGETQARMDWNKAGIPVQRPRTDDVEIGISDVIELFKTKRLKVSKNCKILLNELAIYSRKLDSMGQPTNDIQNKNAFHLLDCLRYIVVSLVGGGWSRGPGK